jgi:hypothetical protein
MTYSQLARRIALVLLLGAPIAWNMGVEASRGEVEVRSHLRVIADMEKQGFSRAQAEQSIQEVKDEARRYHLTQEYHEKQQAIQDIHQAVNCSRDYRFC